MKYIVPSADSTDAASKKDPSKVEGSKKSARSLEDDLERAKAMSLETKVHLNPF